MSMLGDFYIQKLAKDSTVIQDIAAGVDPTEHYTYDLARNNENNHLQHRVIQDLSGAVAALGSSAAITAAGSGLAYLAMKKINPEKAEGFKNVLKDSISSLNPKAIFTKDKSSTMNPVTAVTLGAGAIDAAMEGYATDLQYRTGLNSKKEVPAKLAAISQKALDKIAKLNPEDVDTPKELYDFMQKNIKYGYTDSKGRKHLGEISRPKEAITMALKYRLQSPEELTESGTGICWDQTGLEDYVFDNIIKKPNDIFYARRKTLTGTPHSFLVYQDKGKHYLFENSFKGINGIHKFDTQEQAVDFVGENLLKKSKNPNEKVETFKIDETPNPGAGTLGYLGKLLLDREMYKEYEKSARLALVNNVMEKLAKLKDDVELYPHQERAVNRILNNRNSIIAHSTGAGKTLSTIAGFETLKEKGKADKALVVVPASLRDNFGISGVRKFTDSSYNIVGNKLENLKNSDHYKDVSPDTDYNIVSYEMFRKDPEKYVRGSGADTVIFDELHRGKNITKTYKAIRDSRHLYDNFIGGTGSIVSNKLTDVLPLIDSATGGREEFTKRDNMKAFEKKYFKRDNSPRYRSVAEARKPIVDLKNKEELRRFLDKYIDYAGFEDIRELANMPDKKVKKVFVPLSEDQAHAYNKLLKSDKELDKLIRQRRYQYLKDDELSKLYNQMIEARKLMNDVGTIEPKMNIKDTVELTPKTKTMLDDVSEHLDEDKRNKVLLGSFLVRGGTEALAAGLENRNIPYGMFIGKGNDGVTEESRQKAVEEFNRSKKRALIVSSAGGEGLSLDDATEIFLLDQHFNPERTKQMEARGIRSGGLSYKKPEDRVITANRYISKMPDKKLLFLHWKDKTLTPDEIIDEISTKKELQNQLLFNLLRKNNTF